MNRPPPLAPPSPRLPTYQPDADACGCFACEAERDQRSLLRALFAQDLRPTRRQRAAQALRALLNRCTARLQRYWKQGEP